jgi:hypothetical protein
LSDLWTHAPQQKQLYSITSLGKMSSAGGAVSLGRLGGCGVDYKIEFLWILDRQFAKLGAAQDAIDAVKYRP